MCIKWLLLSLLCYYFTIKYNEWLGRLCCVLYYLTFRFTSLQNKMWMLQPSYLLFFFTVELFTGSCVSCRSLLWRIYRATLLCEAAPFAWRYHASCWFVIFVNSVLGWTVFASGARWVMWIFRSPERWEKIWRTLTILAWRKGCFFF